jgi:hypothetical protein
VLLSAGEFVEKFNKAHEVRIIRATKSFARLSEYRIKVIMSNKDKLRYHRMFSGQRLVCGVGDIFVVIDGQFTSSRGETFSAGENPEIGSLEHTADEVAGALTAISDEGLLVSIARDQLLEQIQLGE